MLQLREQLGFLSRLHYSFSNSSSHVSLLLMLLRHFSTTLCWSRCPQFLPQDKAVGFVHKACRRTSPCWLPLLPLLLLACLLAVSASGQGGAVCYESTAVALACAPACAAASAPACLSACSSCPRTRWCSLRPWTSLSCWWRPRRPSATLACTRRTWHSTRSGSWSRSGRT